MNIRLLASAALMAAALPLTAAKGIDAAEFAAPPVKYRPVPLWFWNNAEVRRDTALRQLESFTGIDGYGGCAILPFGGNFAPKYMSDEYLDTYGAMVDYAREKGLTMSLYDEYGFPSGSMGAINGDGNPRFMTLHPEATIKRLDKHEYAVTPATANRIALPAEGRLMSVVAMDTVTFEIRPLSGAVQGHTLTWTAPADGAWKVLAFVCVKDGDPNVDYLDPAAVRLFVEDTHQRYYDRFPDAFGTVITETFCDEPTMYRAQGRIWTDSFNERFAETYGFSPEALYPALWYNIGPDTGTARNLLFGMRSKLYSEGFMKTIHEWAEAHGIESTGHQDQEEVLNPVSVSGDLMLCGKHMDIPGIDKIGGDRPAELFYKVVSSSAANWDKQRVMSETFGAMGNIPVGDLYSIAMDQYTKGINQLIPHAVWYNDADVTFLPELSWRNPLYNSELPRFNRFLSRLNYMLQRPGRTVADIAMLYPIQTLQAGHYLDGPEGFYAGGVRIPGTDYIEVASILSDTIGRDFTYLHPEVLAACSVSGGTLNLDNEINHQHFRVLILPGVRYITAAQLDVIEKFAKAGGKIIFTTALPDGAADFDTDAADVKARVTRLMADKKNPAVFIPRPDTQTIESTLDSFAFKPDISTPGARGLRHIHRVADGQHIYYFANPGKETIETEVTLRDKVRLTALDPHTGMSRPAGAKAGSPLPLRLEPGRSVFFISR